MLSKVAENIKHLYLTFYTFKQSEPIASLAGLFSFAMGVQAVHNLSRTYYFKDREIVELYQELPAWKQKAFKTADLLGNVSLLLDSLNSWPLIAVEKWTVQKILTPDQITRFFGPKGLLPAEKIHSSFATTAFILGIPITLKILYAFSNWALNQFYRKERVYTSVSVDEVDMIITVKTATRVAKRMILNSPRR